MRARRHCISRRDENYFALLREHHAVPTCLILLGRASHRDPRTILHEHRILREMSRPRLNFRDDPPSFARARARRIARSRRLFFPFVSSAPEPRANRASAVRKRARNSPRIRRIATISRDRLAASRRRSRAHLAHLCLPFPAGGAEKIPV